MDVMYARDHHYAVGAGLSVCLFMGGALRGVDLSYGF